MAYRFLFDAPKNGRFRKATVTVLDDSGKACTTDMVNLVSMKERASFAKRLAKKLKVKEKDLADNLEAAWGEVVKTNCTAQTKGGEEEEEDDSQRISQADRLVLLARDMELFHTPGGYDSEGFATFTVNGHQETWPVNSKGFRRYLSKRFYENFEKVPGSQALQDALTTISGNAIHDGPEHEVAVRLAQRDGAIYLDLADRDWRAVRVTPGGWDVISDPPVKFVRRRGMLALPEPVTGGKVDELRPLVNLSEDRSWVLFVAWLLGAMRPGRPIPPLAVNGEQGSAKSTLCRMGRATLDPSEVPLRRPPRDDRDLMIAATNSWVVAYDNLSGVSDALSDALCSLATGGGFGTRALYTDGEEKLFSALRPVLLNGIEDIATRPDMLDRSVSLTLDTIPDEQRRDEEGLWREYEAVRPRVLGALLDAVSMALRNLPHTRLDSKPRMADFALWVTAAEPALGWRPGTFMEAYLLNRKQQNALALESSLITPTLMAFMKDRQTWNGVLKELHLELNKLADEVTRNMREWPKSPRSLSGKLRHLTPNLRRAGLEVTFHEHSRTGTPVSLEKVCETPSPPSPPSPPLQGKGLGCDDVCDGQEGTASLPSPRPSHPNSLSHNAGDGGDDSDDLLQAFSEEAASDVSGDTYGDALEG